MRGKLPKMSAQEDCTFKATGASTRHTQDWFYCHDCELVGERGCCASCAAACHALHRLELHRVGANFFCDCGATGMCEEASAEQRTRVQAHMREGGCSFDLTQRRFAMQPHFECLTCGLTGAEGVCDACRRTCHSGHLVVKRSDAAPFFCDCGAKSMCARFRPEKLTEHMAAERCSFDLTGRTYARQDWYQCHTCPDMGGLNGCCLACVRTCHDGHDVSLREIGASFFCDCGAKGLCGSLRERGRLERHMAEGGCSFELTGRRFVKQACYTCRTCDLTEETDKGCCAACVQRCHRGHETILSSTTAFFCDCGAAGMCSGLRELAEAGRASAASALAAALDDVESPTRRRSTGGRRRSSTGRTGGGGGGGRSFSSVGRGGAGGTRRDDASDDGNASVDDGRAPGATASSEASASDGSEGTGAAEGTTKLDSERTPSADETKLCVVCLDGPRAVVLVHGDTGHQCVCTSCATLLKTRGDGCPLCRAPIDYVVRNFGGDT